MVHLEFWIAENEWHIELSNDVEQLYQNVVE